MTKDEALKIALEALEWSYGGEPMPTKEAEAINAIRQALAEWTPDDTAYRPDGLSQDSDQLPDTTKMIDKDFALNVALEALYNFADDQSVDGWKAIDAIGVVRKALSELPPVKSYCGGKPNYCEPPPDQLPDATKMIDNVYIRYWVQDTMESGHWATTDSMERTTAEILMSGTYGNTFYRGEIVELPEMPVDRGAWSDVEDATKWVDELRGDDKQCSSCGGFCGDVCEREDVEPDLLNQTCCGCGRAGGYALYCGWCWSEFDKPVAAVNTSEERVPNSDKQRHEWQWLTEEDIHDLFMSNETVDDYGEFETIVCAASTKLKEKNNG